MQYFTIQEVYSWIKLKISDFIGMSNSLYTTSVTHYQTFVLRRSNQQYILRQSNANLIYLVLQNVNIVEESDIEINILPGKRNLVLHRWALRSKRI